MMEKKTHNITRSEALKKMGKYAAITAGTTFAILNPKIAAAYTLNSGGTSGTDGRQGSFWKK